VPAEWDTVAAVVVEAVVAEAMVAVTTKRIQL
jgi:hypothetical protein